jgi:ubiquinone/menaquinone biosynthesis C-methylase UbiE
VPKQYRIAHSSCPIGKRKLNSKSMYTREMLPFYLRARRIPREVTSLIATEASIGSHTTVLDIGTGTGEVALALAKRSSYVTGIDICEPFLDSAKDTAFREGVSVSFLKQSGNGLLFSDRKYDVITISQAFHWLDPRLAGRGIYRVLESTGMLFFIESKPVLADNHPMRRLIPYACSSSLEVENECNRHALKYWLLFETLRQGNTVIHVNQVWIFRQRQMFDMDYAQAFASRDRLTRAGPSGNDLASALADAIGVTPISMLYGDMYWLVIEMRKMPAEMRPCLPLVRIERCIDIPA